MVRKIFLTLSILFISLGVVSFFNSLSFPPPQPYFMHFKNNAESSTTTPGNVYQFVLRSLEPLSGSGELFGVIFHGDRRQKEVALTFDADMTHGMQEMLTGKKVTSLYDDKLIEILINRQIPATLFLSGLWVETYPEITKELAANPLFELGSHSYTHRAYAFPCFNLEKLPEAEKVGDIGYSQVLIEKFTGKKTALFRFPGGCFSPGDLALLKLSGMKAIAWDTVADDGFNTNVLSITNNVISRVKNGSIIVMHMNGNQNEPVDYLAVPLIIDSLTQKGYKFVTVGKLLNLSYAQ